MSLSFLNIYSSVILLWFVVPGNAQENYVTRNGKILITANNSNRVTKLHSDKVQIQLNLQTAEFSLSLPIWWLHSEIDSLDRKLSLSFDEWMHIKGMLNLNEIKTTPHEPYHFKFDAIIAYKDILTDIQGYGHLEHIPGNDQPACRLGLNFELSDFELFHGYSEDLVFQIIQSILNQSEIE